jgi:hypothetical protein
MNDSDERKNRERLADTQVDPLPPGRMAYVYGTDPGLDMPKDKHALLKALDLASDLAEIERKLENAKVPDARKPMPKVPAPAYVYGTDPGLQMPAAERALLSGVDFAEKKRQGSDPPARALPHPQAAQAGAPHARNDAPMVPGERNAPTVPGERSAASNAGFGKLTAAALLVSLVGLGGRIATTRTPEVRTAASNTSGPATGATTSAQPSATTMQSATSTAAPVPTAPRALLSAKTAASTEPSGTGRPGQAHALATAKAVNTGAAKATTSATAMATATPLMKPIMGEIE